jgi:hypothetical protein
MVELTYANIMRKVQSEKTTQVTDLKRDVEVFGRKSTHCPWVGVTNEQ